MFLVKQRIQQLLSENKVENPESFLRVMLNDTATRTQQKFIHAFTSFSDLSINRQAHGHSDLIESLRHFLSKSIDYLNHNEHTIHNLLWKEENTSEFCATFIHFF